MILLQLLVVAMLQVIQSIIMTNTQSRKYQFSL